MWLLIAALTLKRKLPQDTADPCAHELGNWSYCHKFFIEKIALSHKYIIAGRQLELSQPLCNGATRYASPHKRHQLTSSSYIGSQSFAKSLLPFLVSLPLHTVVTHQTALHSERVDGKVLFSLSVPSPRAVWLLSYAGRCSTAGQQCEVCGF